MFGPKAKRKAVSLRKRGYSLNEISRLVEISQSTASLWLKDVKLSEEAKERISSFGSDGRKKAVETNRRKREAEDARISEKVEAHRSLHGRSIDPKIACALPYQCEGTKYDGNKSVSFINAGPEMIRYFLQGEHFPWMKENSGRLFICMNITMRKTVSILPMVTRIPIGRFNESHLKKHTGKSKKENYPGCVSIRYSDSRIYKELMFLIGKPASR